MLLERTIIKILKQEGFEFVEKKALETLMALYEDRIAHILGVMVSKSIHAGRSSVTLLDGMEELENLSCFSSRKHDNKVKYHLSPDDIMAISNAMSGNRSIFDINKPLADINRPIPDVNRPVSDGNGPVSDNDEKRAIGGHFSERGELAQRILRSRRDSLFTLPGIPEEKIEFEEKEENEEWISQVSIRVEKFIHIYDHMPSFPPIHTFRMTIPKQNSGIGQSTKVKNRLEQSIKSENNLIKLITSSGSLPPFINYLYKEHR